MHYSFLVENIAHNKKVWVNDQRHQWADWTRGLASLAVDGRFGTYLNQCAIVENFKNEEPIFMIDLGKRQEIRGVILKTWQGQGEGI